MSARRRQATKQALADAEEFVDRVVRIHFQQELDPATKRELAVKLAKAVYLPKTPPSPPPA